MKKYVEIGIGNTWIIRTELESEDGYETEVKGISMPNKVKSLYLRVWINYTVIVIDSTEGLKITKKNKRKFKILIGIFGYDE